MDMGIALGSRANVRELFEILEVIDSTRFGTLPSSRERTVRAVDYHPGRTSTGEDFVYYDPWTSINIYEQSASSRTAATRVVPEDVPIYLVHVDNKTSQTLRNTSSDYVPAQVSHGYGCLRQQQDNCNVDPTSEDVNEPVGPGVVASNGGGGLISDNDVVVVRTFLEDNGVLSMSYAQISIT